MYCFRLKSGTADGLESDYAVAAAFSFLRFFGGEYAGFFRLDLDCRQGTLVNSKTIKNNMDLFERVSEDIKNAMRAKDKVALETLRNIKKVFLEAKTAPGANDTLTDAEAGGKQGNLEDRKSVV